MTPNLSAINRRLRQHGCDSHTIQHAPSGLRTNATPYVEFDMAKGLPVRDLTLDEVVALAKHLGISDHGFDPRAV